MPLAVATSASVWRRAGVVAGCLLGGFVTGQVEHGVLAAFGAIQTGLVEAVMPRRSLAKLLALVVFSVVLMAFLGSLVAGSWWAVVLLGAVAFVQGASLGTGTIPTVVFMGALAMGVIFSGEPRSASQALTATVWVGVGAIVQALGWAVSWRRERRMFVRRALANHLAQVIELVRFDDINGRDMAVAAGTPDAIAQMLARAGLPVRQRAAAEQVGVAIAELRRAVVAWMAVRRPGVPTRVAFGEQVRRARRRLFGGGRRADAVALEDSERRPGLSASRAAESGRWLSEVALAEALAEVERAVAALNDTWRATRADRDDAVPRTPERLLAPMAVAVRPGTPTFRHGIRMTVAIMIAEAFTLLVPVVHSFWVPLTVVFILKPDWSFTVLRSATRFLGNFAAVLVVPLLWTWAGNTHLATVVLVSATSLLMFKFFTGNYALASFGLAGAVLMLDETMAASPKLYEIRVIATVVGVVIALAVALAIPTWRGVDGWPLLQRVLDGLDSWWALVRAGVRDPAAVSASEVNEIREAVRRDIAEARPVVEASVLEPGQKQDPRPLVLALQAAERADVSVLALSNLVLAMQRQGYEGCGQAGPGSGTDPEVGGADPEVGTGFGSSADEGSLDVGVAERRRENPVLNDAVGYVMTDSADRVSTVLAALRQHSESSDQVAVRDKGENRVVEAQPQSAVRGDSPLHSLPAGECVAVADEVSRLASSVAEIAAMCAWGQQAGARRGVVE